jgi:hypothetical protein
MLAMDKGRLEKTGGRWQSKFIKRKFNRDQSPIVPIKEEIAALFLCQLNILEAWHHSSARLKNKLHTLFLC